MGMIPAVRARLRADPLCAHVAAVPNLVWATLPRLVRGVVAGAALVLPWCSVASLLPPPALVGCSEAGACGAGVGTFGCWVVPQPKNWRGLPWRLRGLLWG